MDSDCAFDAEQIQKVADMTPLDTTVYKFDRSRVGTGEVSANYSGEVIAENLAIERFLPCTMLMHKNVFWQTGGFDEDYTGERSEGYGFFDSDFDRRLDDLHIPWCVSNDIAATEWMPSACDGEICNRSDAHHKMARQLYRLKRHANPDRKNEWLTQNREILRFQWERTHWSRYVS